MKAKAKVVPAPIPYRSECPHCDKKFDGVTWCADPRCLRADAIVRYIQAMGSDAISVRDAAHEAAHGIEWNLTNWDRDRITRLNPWRRNPRIGIRDEITARAVEAIVMRKLGLPYDQDRYVLLMVMETLKFDGIALPSFDWAKDAIVKRMESKHAEELADKILAFEHLTPPKRSAKRKG